MNNNKKINFIFFGSGPLAESSLYFLNQNNLIPSLVITTIDKKSGRDLKLKKNIIATWCESKNIKCFQAEKFELNKNNIEKFCDENNLEKNFDIFIVASYPKILNIEILNMPKFGILNIHPSMLPKYRGPSPIQSALLNGDEKTGVSIIKLDEEMDHGPILIQKEIEIFDEDINEKLERKCGALGAELLIKILPFYIDNSLKLKEQEHEKATFTKKFIKEDGEIDFEKTSAIELQNKFRALLPHISIFFFLNIKDKKIRIKITEINLNKNFAKNKLAKDIIKKLIPENKSEMSFEDFKRGYLK